MINQVALKPALHFFYRFLAVSLALSMVYGPFYGNWLSMIVALTNQLLSWGGASIHITQHLDTLSMIHIGLNGERLALRFTGYQMLHLYTIAAMSLLLATPHRQRRKKIIVCTLTLCLFTAFQVVQVYIGSLMALDHYWNTLSSSQQSALQLSGWGPAPTYSPLFKSWFAWWNMWGASGLALGMWIYLNHGNIVPNRSTY